MMLANKEQELIYSFILHKMYKAAKENNNKLILVMQVDYDTLNNVIDKIKESYDVDFDWDYPDYMEKESAENNNIKEIHLTLPIEHTLAKKKLLKSLNEC